MNNTGTQNVCAAGLCEVFINLVIELVHIKWPNRTSVKLKLPLFFKLLANLVFSNTIVLGAENESEGFINRIFVSMYIVKSLMGTYGFTDA